MSEPDPARTRFIILTAVRFGGVAIAFLGISILMKRWIEPADIIGTLLVAFGAFDVILAPLLLIRAWKTPVE